MRKITEGILHAKCYIKKQNRRLVVYYSPASYSLFASCLQPLTKCGSSAGISMESSTRPAIFPSFFQGAW